LDKHRGRVQDGSARDPNKTEGRAPDRPGAVRNLSVVRSCGHSFEEYSMKRIIVALVLALGVFGAVGCGSSSTSAKPTGK
jgi:hypothetical protein